MEKKENQRKWTPEIKIQPGSMHIRGLLEIAQKNAP